MILRRAVVLLGVLLSVSSLYAAHHREVTWSRDVAPIVYRHCSVCHNVGQPVPFVLLTYQDVSRRASQIARVVATRYMPPWKPIAGYGHFIGEKSLSAAEISVISRWVANGSPEGDPRDAPAPPQPPSEWQLGAPDAVLRLPEPAPVSADGPDIYRCFVIPTSFGRDRYVRAFEFKPGAAGVLHHALMFVDAQRAELPSQYDCFGTPGFLPTAGLGGWTPGMHAVSMPAGTAIHIANGARIVLQLHFHPTGKAEAADPALALYFASGPPPRALMDIALGSNHIDIPPGDASYKVRDEFEIPVPVEVTGIIPHAHYLCKDMKGWAILPDGHKRWLLWIKDWDFNWQEQYRYTQPFTLPAGTRVFMEFTYDNSAANIRNPNQPPQRVSWGAGSTDEMAGLHIQVIPRNEADMHELGMAEWGKFMRSVGGRFYTPPPKSE
jgi:hypothetical protein